MTEGNDPTAVVVVVFPKLIVGPHSNQALMGAVAELPINEFNCALVFVTCVACVVTTVNELFTTGCVYTGCDKQVDNRL